MSISGRASGSRLLRFPASVLGAALVAAALAGCGGSSPPEPEDRAVEKVGTWTKAGTLATARGGQTESFLGDGKVLIVGGQQADVYAPMRSAEIFDPATGTWKATGEMSAARNAHTATVLGDGKVLVTGGLVTAGAALNSAEIFDPATGTWSAAAAMSVARLNHTATLLPDGKVLVAGGFSLVDTPGLQSAEIYDPAADAWAPAASMAAGRGLHTASVLAGGRVLVAAGNEVGSFRRTAVEATSTTVTNGLAAPAPNGKGEIATAEIFDPATGQWAPTGPLKKGRSFHTATNLIDGRVLVVGGLSPDGELDSAEIYDPATGAWELTGALPGPRGVHTAALLPDGQVLVAGGQVGASGSILSSILASAALYDPGTAKWKQAADMGTPRSGHSVTVLATGQVLVVGGQNSIGPVGDAEVFAMKAKAGL